MKISLRQLREVVSRVENEPPERHYNKRTYINFLDHDSLQASWRSNVSSLIVDIKFHTVTLYSDGYEWWIEL